MNQIYFLSWMSDSVERQIKELEKLLDFKMHVGYPSTTEKEMEHQIRWAEKNGMVAIICNLTLYETVMDHRPMIPVYPVELRYYDTCVILQLLKRDLKKKELAISKGDFRHSIADYCPTGHAGGNV